jgi:catechol 2,3-dioxygenase-like lactoylglutathione lyase family enzyme
MKFNGLVPELLVSDIKRSIFFYVDVLGFQIEFERPEDGFVFLSIGEAQIMLEQKNDHWFTGDLEYPYGRGINFEIEVKDVDYLARKLEEKNYKLFRDVHEKWYKTGEVSSGQRQFLVQDPDGYLLRFCQVLEK